MSPGAEATAFLALMLVLLSIPSVLMVFFGWRKTRFTQPPLKQLAVRSFIGSFAFTPLIHGHAGPVLAWWILIFGTWEERFWWSVVPIVSVWSVSFGICYILRRQ